jgi:hypothetical protein
MEKLAAQALATRVRPQSLMDGRGDGVTSRAEQLRNMTPQLIADVTLYATAAAKEFKDAGTFFLWEGGFIGEAIVVSGS